MRAVSLQRKLWFSFSIGPCFLILLKRSTTSLFRIASQSSMLLLLSRTVMRAVSLYRELWFFQPIHSLSTGFLLGSSFVSSFCWVLDEFLFRLFHSIFVRFFVGFSLGWFILFLLGLLIGGISCIRNHWLAVFSYRIASKLNRLLQLYSEQQLFITSFLLGFGIDRRHLWIVSQPVTMVCVGLIFERLPHCR